jgi:hypothetical protein
MQRGCHKTGWFDQDGRPVWIHQAASRANCTEAIQQRTVAAVDRTKEELIGICEKGVLKSELVLKKRRNIF